MAELSEFISTVKQRGMARTNRFSVVIGLPRVINSFDGDLRSILLYCDQAQLPGLNYSTIQNRSFGEFREVPYEKLYGDIQLNFYVDKNLEVKKFFDDWAQSIQDGTSRTFNYYNDYISQMEITVEDLLDNSIYTVTCYECYPKQIAPIQLDYSNKEVMKLQVTMQYKYWRKGNAGGDNVSNNSNFPNDWESFVDTNAPNLAEAFGVPYEPVKQAVADYGRVKQAMNSLTSIGESISSWFS